MQRYHSNLSRKLTNSIVYKTNKTNQQLAHLTGMDVYATTNDKITFLLKKLVLSNAKEFIGVQETRYLMDIMERKYNELVKELQRQLGLSKIVDILQRLVEENVSIRDLRTIFETLIFWSTKRKGCGYLVRIRSYCPASAYFRSL